MHSECTRSALECIHKKIIQKMPAKKNKSSKKQAESLSLDAPPASDSEDEQILEITVSPNQITTVSTVTISESSASAAVEDDVDNQEVDMLFLVSKIQDDIRSDIKEINKEIAGLTEIINQKKMQIKEKSARLKLWDKRVSTPTTVENASLAVKVRDNDRQLHNTDDGSCYYKSGAKKQFIQLSAVKVSTKSVREAGKPVLDGKEAKVHIKDKTVTLSDIESAEETELIQKLNELSSK